MVVYNLHKKRFLYKRERVPDRFKEMEMNRKLLVKVLSLVYTAAFAAAEWSCSRHANDEVSFFTDYNNIEAVIIIAIYIYN